MVLLVCNFYCTFWLLFNAASKSLSNRLYPRKFISLFKKRARRILPPLYAAIIFCCVLALIILTLERFTSFQWREVQYDWFSPDFSFLDVILHFLVIHNFAPGTDVYIINVPLWSVALDGKFTSYFL
jgi:peptidoglycan/LPS O-acetylase OafA/YrhL